MQKLFKNGKKFLATVFALVIIAASLFIGGMDITADACDLTKIDYWDGTKATTFASGDGSQTNPFIIKTAEELALCCLGQDPNTSGAKYYKVDDSVKTFVMQPEDVVDLDTLLSLDTPDAVNAYLSSLEGVKNWMSVFNRLSFSGNFDGNGATVYGLYATSVGTEDKNGKVVDDVGLFPQYDGGKKVGSRIYTNTCKNIAVKNSYFYSQRRMGAIVGAAYLEGYGAGVSGMINIESCAVVNCYMIGLGEWNYFTEQGIVACGGNEDVIQIKNVLVKDVYAVNTDKKANINIVGSGSSRKQKEQYMNTVTDSIFLGTTPYGLDYFTDKIHEPYLYTNVVTDMPSGVVDCSKDTATYSRDYTDHIYSITKTGVDFKKEANMLDWKNTWFMGENGPELRVFHSGLELIATETTHIWECDCCDAQSAGGVTEHTFKLVGDTIKGDGSDVYMCVECDYVCQHNEQTDAEYDPGDCVTKAGVYIRCKFCDWYFANNLSDVSGHDLIPVAKDIGDCETLGHEAYYLCTVCNNKFLTDDVFAAMNTAQSDEALSTGYGPHTKECDEDGNEIILYDENGHWYKCTINGGRLDFESNDLGETGVIKHTFKKSVCTDCGYECKNHSYKLTGKVDVAHSCDTDEMSELQCEYCKTKTTVLTKPASHTIVKVEKVLPDDRTEGTKEHYKCDVCKEVYVDAEGKTLAETAALVIPKVLSEEYLKQVNADLGGTSPSTSDSLASIFALAALAGAALVMTRKVK